VGYKNILSLCSIHAKYFMVWCFSSVLAGLLIEINRLSCVGRSNMKGVGEISEYRNPPIL
jgi:hypothetical protein